MRWDVNTTTTPKQIGGKLCQPGEGNFVEDGPIAAPDKTGTALTVGSGPTSLTLEQITAAKSPVSGAGNPRIRLVTKHACASNGGTSTSNGTTQVSGTDKLSFVLNAEVKNLQFLFQHYIATGPYMQVAPVGNALNIYACVIQAGKNVTIPMPSTGAAISTGGRTASSVQDGGYVLSAPVSTGVLAKGSVVEYRMYKVVPSGGKWILNGSITGSNHYSPGPSGTTDFVYGSTVVDGTDKTVNNADATGAFAAGAKYYGATAIIGEQVTPTAVCLILGDSIPIGYLSSGGGYIANALDDAGIGYLNAGVASLAAEWAAKTGGGVYGILPKYADHIINHVLTNDIYVTGTTTLAGVKANLLAYAKEISAPNNKLWFATLIPRNTSTDGGATYANQTISDAAKEALRVQTNNWLRDTSSDGAVAYLNANLAYKNVAGVFDPAVIIERNSDGSPLVFSGTQQTSAGGYWLVNGTASYYTTDQVHPSNNAAALMKACVPVTQFTI